MTLPSPSTAFSYIGFPRMYPEMLGHAIFYKMIVCLHGLASLTDAIELCGDSTVTNDVISLSYQQDIEGGRRDITARQECSCDVTADDDGVLTMAVKVSINYRQSCPGLRLKFNHSATQPVQCRSGQGQLTASYSLPAFRLASFGVRLDLKAKPRPISMTITVQGSGTLRGTCGQGGYPESSPSSVGTTQHPPNLKTTIPFGRPTLPSENVTQHGPAPIPGLSYSGIRTPATPLAISSGTNKTEANCSSSGGPLPEGLAQSAGRGGHETTARVVLITLLSLGVGVVAAVVSLVYLKRTHRLYVCGWGAKAKPDDAKPSDITIHDVIYAAHKLEEQPVSEMEIEDLVDVNFILAKDTEGRTLATVSLDNSEEAKASADVNVLVRNGSSKPDKRGKTAQPLSAQQLKIAGSESSYLPFEKIRGAVGSVFLSKSKKSPSPGKEKGEKGKRTVTFSANAPRVFASSSRGQRHNIVESPSPDKSLASQHYHSVDIIHKPGEELIRMPETGSSNLRSSTTSTAVTSTISVYTTTSQTIPAAQRPATERFAKMEYDKLRRGPQEQSPIDLQRYNHIPVTTPNPSDSLRKMVHKGNSLNSSSRRSFLGRKAEQIEPSLSGNSLSLEPDSPRRRSRLDAKATANVANQTDKAETSPVASRNVSREFLDILDAISLTEVTFPDPPPPSPPLPEAPFPDPWFAPEDAQSECEDQLLTSQILIFKGHYSVPRSTADPALCDVMTSPHFPESPEMTTV